MDLSEREVLVTSKAIVVGLMSTAIGKELEWIR